MKKRQILVTALAFVFAIGSAFASMLTPPNSEAIHPVNQQCVQKVTQQGCTRNGNINCTVQFNSTTVLAKELNSNCTIQLKRFQ